MSDIENIARALQATLVNREDLAKVIEEVSSDQRIAMMESIDGSGQAKIWNACEGHGVSIQDLVPASLGPLKPVIFHGKNSLPAFTRFQKRFCRPSADESADVLWGYNYQPATWLAPLTGPGYFVAYDSESPLGGVAIDYRRVPHARPSDWPEIHDNKYRLSRFIYNGMVDYLRRVSEHVYIGRATRAEKELPNYFLLCREDPTR